MGLVNPTLNNRVQFTIKSDIANIQVPEPDGWKTDAKEYARNEDYFGITTKFTVGKLKYTGEGAQLLKLIYELEDIEADAIMIREERHPQTDLWTETFRVDLDFSTYEEEDGAVSIKGTPSGLEKLLKARENEKVEIERTKSIGGFRLPNLKTETLKQEGRRIFLKTRYNFDGLEDKVELRTRTTDNDRRGDTYTLPLNLFEKSHDKAKTPIVGSALGDNSTERNSDGEVGLMFFLNSDRNRNLKIDFQISFQLNIERFDGVANPFFLFRIAKYQNGSDFIFKEDYRYLEVTGDNFRSLDGQTLTLTASENIQLLEGESLSMEFSQYFTGLSSRRSYLDTDCVDLKGTLSIEEDSVYPSTTTKFVLAHELAERLAQIITDKKDSFHSSFFGRKDLGYKANGFGSFVGLAHGFWIRGFDKLPENDENKFKPLTTSFKEFIESMSAIWNLGLGIETLGFKERIIIEPTSYFFNKNVTIKLPNQIKKVKRTVATDFYYSGLEFGFKKGGDYEEAMGLDEYNVKTTYSTFISRVKKVYNKVSEYRADSYGKEFARRKQKLLNPTEDTSYDNDIFVLDLKKQSSTYAERKWQDDFEKAPTGVFSPETATNLRLSPVNILLRHAWFFATGLAKYPEKFVRYGSSKANTNLSTKPIGAIERKENEDIINNDLPPSRFSGQWIEFDHIVDFETIQDIEGFTTIEGKRIRNFYGQVEFINEDGEKERGYIFSIKPNGAGRWKILKAKR